jgi:hypothetical protein
MHLVHPAASESAVRLLCPCRSGSVGHGYYSYSQNRAGTPGAGNISEEAPSDNCAPLRARTEPICRFAGVINIGFEMEKRSLSCPSGFKVIIRVLRLGNKRVRFRTKDGMVETVSEIGREYR